MTEEQKRRKTYWLANLALALGIITPIIVSAGFLVKDHILSSYDKLGFLAEAKSHYELLFFNYALWFALCYVIFVALVAFIAIYKIIRSHREMVGSSKAVIGIIFAVLLTLLTIPNFFHFPGPRNEASDAHKILRRTIREQEACLAEQGKYCRTWKEIEKKANLYATRYSYFMSPEEILPAEQGEPYKLPLNIKAFVEDDRYQIVAVGNVDKDEVLDVWAVNEKKELIHLVDDFKYKKWSEVKIGTKPERFKIYPDA